MKKLINILLLLALLIPESAFSGELFKINYQRKLQFSFQVGDKASFDLINKFGDVSLQQWEENKISVRVTITVKASSKEQAKGIAEGIKIERNQNGNNVSVKTIYNNTRSSSSFWDLFFGGNTNENKKIKIDYKIYLPKSLGTLDIQNKYGGITGNQIPGNVRMQLSYGHFHLNGIKKQLSFRLKYSEGSLTDIKNATLESAYTDLHIDRIQNMVLQYKYGDIKINRIAKASIKGSYGDIYAEHISRLQANTSYSDYSIGLLERQAVISSNYGDVHIQQTGSKLKDLQVTLKYSDLFLKLPPHLPLKLQVSLQYGDLISTLSGLSVEKNIEKGAQSYFSAHSTGTNAHATIINLNGKYADIKLVN